MNVKEAVDLAKQHVADLFAKEGLINLGLEEVEYDDARDQWRITLGFSRSWDHQQGMLAALAASATRRTYKIVIIAKDGTPVAVKNREPANAG